MAINLEDDSADENSAPKTGEVSAPGADQHAQEIANASPEVQQHAIDEAARQSAASEAEIPVDSKGVKFDSKIHTGSKLKSGEWRTRKTASTLNVPKKSKAQSGGGELVMTELQEQKARMAGAAAASMMFASLTQFFGDEWQPRTEKEAGFDERKLMGDAFGDYFVAKNISDFPPGVTLAFVTLGYFCARLNMPKTKEKVSTFKTWCALRYARYKLKKEFKKQGIVARVEIKDGVLTVNGKANWTESDVAKTPDKKK